MSARIWTTFERGGNHGGEYRELENVSRNERGDFVFTLDGGERWQFTPHNSIAPTVENVKQLGIGKDGKTGKPSMLAFLILTSGEKCVGNLRIFPPATDSKVEDAIAAIARALPGSARPTKEKLVKIGDKYWPLEKTVCNGTGAGPEGEPPKTREGLDKWQRGPKVWQWNELLQFRGFRVWLSITEKECPELAESIRGGTQFIPGPVEEITPPDMARFQFAGGVKVRLTVEKYSAEGAPPLSPEEIKAAGEIIDALEGRAKQAAPRKGGDIELVSEIKTLKADNAETHRLLHRANRKLDGVPPLVSKIGDRNKMLADAAAELHRKVNLTSEQWKTYAAHWKEGKTQTAIAVERGWPKRDAYKVNRECRAIERAFVDAGEPIPPKLTRHNAMMGADGVVFKKPAKKRKGRD